MGPTKAKAKSVAMDMAHGFANAVAGRARGKVPMPDRGGMS